MVTDAKTGLTVLLGPANSGKLGRVLEWWQQRLVQRPVVIAPTGPDARELTDEMVRRQGGLIDQVGAVTFDGLVRLVVGRSPRYAGDLERDLILRRLLEEVPTTALAGAARLPGAVTALASLLRQLAESGRGPLEVDRILARWAITQPSVADLSADIRRLTDAQQRMYERLGLDDRPVVVREATAQAVAGSWDRPVAFYGFTSFTPGQRLLVERFAACTEVLVTFTYDPRRAVNLSTPAEISWWRSKATEFLEVAPAARAYHSPAIEYLERQFMRDERGAEAPPAWQHDRGVRFLLASGRRAEAELAAEQIAELIRSGVPPEEIAVVARNVYGWSPLLSRVFDSCAIPFHVDDRPTIGRTGFGHAFISALKGVALDDASALLVYIRGPYSGLSADAAADLELRYRRSSAKGARALSGLANAMGSSEVSRLWEVVPATGERAGHVVDPVAAVDLAGRMLAACMRRSVPGSTELAEDASAYRTLTIALETMAGLAFANGEPAQSDGFLDWRTVLAALSSVTVAQAGAHDRAAVQVMSVQRARARRFPVVLVLGLVEGEFPGPVERPSLLTPEQRAQLDAEGAGLFTPESDDEGALFVSAISRASRLLLLSARNAEDDGSEATPSHFWEWARRLLGVEPGDHQSRTLRDQVFSPECAPTRRHYDRACAAKGLSPGSSRVLGATMPQVGSWSCTPGLLSDPAVLDELAATKRFSPSALETYAKCPFAWFVQRVVGAEELDAELDAKRIGQLLHAALSETYQQLDAVGCLPLRAEHRQLATETSDGIIQRLVAGEGCPGSLADRRLAGWRLRRMTRNLFDMEISADWPLTPIEMEMWVGGRQGVDVGGFCIHGRIDRVDAPPQSAGVFVIDYKSGAISSPSALGGAEALQLPLYLLALAAGPTPLRVLGGAYLGLSDAKRSGLILSDAEHLFTGATDGCRVLDEEGLGELFRRTREVSQEAIEGMKRGDIAPRKDRSCPPWCALAAACRARRGGYRP